MGWCETMCESSRGRSRMRQDGDSFHSAMVRPFPFLSAGLWPLCPDPAQQAAAPAGTDQPADQQGDEDACWGRKPFQVSPGPWSIHLVQRFGWGGGNAISLYREGGIKLSRKHLQAACRKGMLLDYQLCFFFMFFNLFSFPKRQFYLLLAQGFSFKPLWVCLQVCISYQQLLFALVMLAKGSRGCTSLGLCSTHPGNACPVFSAILMQWGLMKSGCFNALQAC